MCETFLSGIILFESQGGTVSFLRTTMKARAEYIRIALEKLQALMVIGFESRNDTMSLSF